MSDIGYTPRKRSPKWLGICSWVLFVWAQNWPQDGCCFTKIGWLLRGIIPLTKLLVNTIIAL